MVQLAADLLGRPYGPAGPDLSGLRVAVLGATFKPNTDDVRDSPALVGGAQARPDRGRRSRVYDPQGMENASGSCPRSTTPRRMIDAVTGADLVCVLTEWEEFRYADPAALGELVTGQRVIDGLQLPRPAACGRPPAGSTAAWARPHRRAATSLTHASLTVPTICDQRSDEGARVGSSTDAEGLLNPAHRHDWVREQEVKLAQVPGSVCSSGSAGSSRASRPRARHFV